MSVLLGKTAIIRSIATNTSLLAKGSSNLPILKEVEKRLNITQPSDWYKCESKEVIYENGGKKLLRKYGDSLLALLKSAYPDYPWEITK
jgi:hypothetical protein